LPVISGFCNLSRLVTELQAHDQDSEISQKYAERG